MNRRLCAANTVILTRLRQGGCRKLFLRLRRSLKRSLERDGPTGPPVIHASGRGLFTVQLATREEEGWKIMTGWHQGTLFSRAENTDNPFKSREAVEGVNLTACHFRRLSNSSRRSRLSTPTTSWQRYSQPSRSLLLSQEDTVTRTLFLSQGRATRSLCPHTAPRRHYLSDSEILYAVAALD